ncbi:MAG: type II toxin-antitoxin system RelE/ParE family toxin [Synergistaceae bacterium]|nr:type II toxin-antitoxin system RelE/ParE family toxin [Synergistaceae bacterium]
MYEISYSGAAERYLKKIRDKQLLSAFKTAIDRLKTDPYIGTQKTGDLRGIYGHDVKFRGVNYELAYRIYEESVRLVVIILAGTRENFYEELKRIIK